MSSAPNNTANLPKMCSYTYHHDPNCGHINSFSVDACPAFTCSLRQAEDGKPIACTEPTHKHDIVHPSNPSLCIQCEREWAERVKAGVQPVKDKRDGDEEPGLVSLEGTNSPIEVGMAITSPKDRAYARNVENRSKNKGKQPALIGLGIFSDSDAVRVDGDSSAINKVRSLRRRDSANPGKFGIIDDYWNGFSSVDLEESPGPSGHADTRKDEYSDSDYEDPEDFDLSPVSSLAKEPFHDVSVDHDDTESTVDLENEDRDSQVDSLIQEMNELHEITENPLPSFRQFFRSLERYFPVFRFASGGMKLNPEEARKSGL